MFPLIATIATFVVLSVSTMYSTYQKNEKVRNTIQTSQALLTAQKASTVSDLKSPKLSDLAQNSLTDTQKVDLNNFQHAINIAIIKNNIKNPSCKDLAATGYITVSKCNAIENKKNDYAVINSGQMKLDNATQSRIINNIIHFKQNSKNSKNVVTIKPYNKRYMNYKFAKVKKIKIKDIQKVKNIARTNSIAAIQNYTKSTIQKINLKNNTINKKLNLLAILTTDNNRIKQIQEHDIHKTIHTNKTTTAINTPIIKKYVIYTPSKTFVNQYIDHTNIDSSHKTIKAKPKNKDVIMLNSSQQLDEKINSFKSMFTKF